MFKYLSINNYCSRGRYALLKHSQDKSLFKTNKKFYNGLFERPTQSLFSHLQILGFIEVFHYFNSLNNFSWCISIAITSSLIRLIQIPTYYLVKDLKLESLIPQKISHFLGKWSHRLIFNDFNIDMKRHKIDEYEKKLYLKNYDIGVMISYIPQILLFFNNFRALNIISKTTIDGTANLYPSFENDIFNLNLATPDTFFIFPILIFINNYFLLKISDHPWLINWNKNSNNNFKLIIFSFSLLSIIWPKCYCISFISYSFTHILIKLISKFYHTKIKNKKLYKYHVEKVYGAQLNKLIK